MTSWRRDFVEQEIVVHLRERTSLLNQLVNRCNSFASACRALRWQ